MIDNFQKSVNLESVSNIIGMTPTSFCRYFKKRTIKSFHTVLNEIRVGHSCKLLIEGKMNISGIGYGSGFNYISNFNGQFKKIKGISPSQYLKIRKAYLLEQLLTPVFKSNPYSKPEIKIKKKSVNNLLQLFSSFLSFE